MRTKIEFMFSLHSISSDSANQIFRHEFTALILLNTISLSISRKLDPRNFRFFFLVQNRISFRYPTMRCIYLGDKCHCQTWTCRDCGPGAILTSVVWLATLYLLWRLLLRRWVNSSQERSYRFGASCPELRLFIQSATQNWF